MHAMFALHDKPIRQTMLDTVLIPLGFVNIRTGIQVLCLEE